MPSELERALRQHRHSLLGIRHVTGCGVGLKEVRGRATATHALIVFVGRKRPLHRLSPEDRIPPAIDDMPTDVMELGRVRLLNIRTQRVRPAQPGLSIGHFRVSAGTFGAVAYDVETGRPLILSNNHVLANTTNGKDGRSRVGDPVYQPGAYDGGTSADTIGHLRRFSPVFTFGATEAEATAAIRGQAQARHVSLQTETDDDRAIIPVNRIDAALAEPISPDVVNPEVLGLGSIVGTSTPTPGQVVWKSGRTSGVTQGTVRALSVTLNVSMGDAGIAMFEDQIVTSPMGDPGDSGSAGLTGDGRIFGLLFAGSDQATIFNRIQNIAELLRVRFTAE